MEQSWRVYSIDPEAKKQLRFWYEFDLIKEAEKVNFLVRKGSSDLSDDIYYMKINDEQVEVVSRGPDQNRKTLGVLEEIDYGIFYRVSDKNLREAATRLDQIIGAI